MNLKELKIKFATLNKELDNFVEPPPVQVNKIVKGVFPGDVWYYIPNKDFNNHFYTVKSVNKRKNIVWFIDESWNQLDELINNNNWILLARKLTPTIMQKAEQLVKFKE